MRCPNCNSGTLVAQRVKNDPDARVDRCRECGGLWFHPGSLTRVLSVAAKDLKVLDNAEITNRVCPDCMEPLACFKYPQTLVAVDMCPKCKGIWLDKGELEELKAVRTHLEQSGELEVYAPVTGVKGALLRFVDKAINTLSDQLRG